MAAVNLLLAFLLFVSFEHKTFATIDEKICLKNNWATGLYPHPTECHKFIECSNGDASEMTCPSKLAYNPAIMECDDPVKMHCEIEGGETGSTNAPITWGPNEDVNEFCRITYLFNGIHSHPYDCTKFIECSFLRTTIMSCPPGLFYDSRNETCEPASIAPLCMGGTVSPTKSTFSGICGYHRLTVGIHPHPKYCDKFIECTGGKTVEMSCQPGLFYNVGIASCDDVHTVNCNDNINYFNRLIG